MAQCEKGFFKSKYQEIRFLSVIMLAFVAFYIETDIYTPSFPEMVTYFGTDENAIQLLLSMNFLGLCLSSIFFGPASDAYGRKPVLFTGLSIFMLGSIGCALTDSLGWMIAFRLLQGIGCGSIVSAGLALIFDIYPPDQSSRLVSVLNGTLGGLVAFAPMVGNWISLHMGWRVNFYLIACLATLSALSTWFFINETLPASKRVPFKLSTLSKNYISILTNVPFMAHTLIWCFAFSLVIMFISNLSLIFVDYLHVPKELFGYYQTVIMGSFFLGSMSGAYLIQKMGTFYSKMTGSFLFLTGIASLGLLSLVNFENPFLLVLSMGLVSFGCALAGAIYFTYSMGFISSSLNGSAMALSQSLRLFLSFFIVWLVANQFDGTTKPMSFVAIVCTLFCMALYAILYKRREHFVESSQPTLQV